MTWPCDHCPYVAPEKSSLRKHREASHLGITYPCDQCDYKASRPNSLKLHKESKHEGIKYPCPQCDYVALCKSTVKEHIRQGLEYRIVFSLDPRYQIKK